MKQLVYRHVNIAPLVVVLARAVTRVLVRRMGPIISRWIPGAKGRRVIGWTCLGASVIVQIVCIILLQQLVDLCIDLAELWTVLAQKHLEITLDKTS